MEIEKKPNIDSLFEAENAFEFMRKVYDYQDKMKTIPTKIKNRRYKKMEEV